MHPMNSIDDKAKNEVQELLQDLVVSPVSKKIGKEITELSESLSKLQDVPNKFNVLGGIIENKISKISNKLDSLDEEVSNDIGSLENNFLQKIKAKTDNLDGFQSKVIEPLSRLTEVSEEHNRQYQQNRTSFLILISLSVINLLGLIGLIIIHVIH